MVLPAKIERASEESHQSGRLGRFTQRLNSGASFGKVHRTAEIDHRRHMAIHAGVAALALKLRRIHRAQAGHEVAARAGAPPRDAMGGHLVDRRIGPQPPHGSLQS